MAELAELPQLPQVTFSRLTSVSPVGHLIDRALKVHKQIMYVCIASTDQPFYDVNRWLQNKIIGEQNYLNPLRYSWRILSRI